MPQQAQQPIRALPYPQLPTNGQSTNPQTRYPNNVATSATSDHITATAEAAPTLLADYAVLFKLRISTMVIIVKPEPASILAASAAASVPSTPALHPGPRRNHRRHPRLQRPQSSPRAQIRPPLRNALHRRPPHGRRPHLPFRPRDSSSDSPPSSSAHSTSPTPPTSSPEPLPSSPPSATSPSTPRLKRITTINTFIGAFPEPSRPSSSWTAARGMHRVARRRSLRHPLPLAVPPLHGHRLDVPRRLRPRRHPPHPHSHRRPLRRSFYRHPGSLLRTAHDPRQPLALRPRHRRIPVRSSRLHPQHRLPLVHPAIRAHRPQPRITRLQPVRPRPAPRLCHLSPSSVSRHDAQRQRTTALL